MEGCAVDHAEGPGTLIRSQQGVNQLIVPGHLLLRPRRSLDPLAQRLAALEPRDQVQRTWSRREDTTVVVGRQQLEGTRWKITVTGHEASKERV
jgi:hypothetical protein